MKTVYPLQTKFAGGIKEAIMVSLIQHFEADFQNPEFRNNPENFYLCLTWPMICLDGETL